MGAMIQYRQVCLVYGGSTVPRAPTDARDRLLAAAGRLFYRHGIARTGIDTVIAEAGVAKMTLYHHFGSKEGLALAWLDARHGDWMAAFTESLARGRPGLAGAADAVGAWFDRPGFRGCAFINAVCESVPAPAIAGIALRHTEALRDCLRARLPAGAPAGLADQALLVVEGLIVRLQMTGDRRCVDEARALLGLLDRTAAQ
jgi:AcrR family transcriptional regulator